MKETGEDGQKKPCRACYDFKSWAKLSQSKVTGGTSNGNGESGSPPGECPVDKDELGRSTWAFLHTMAAYFPSQPTPQEQKEMSVFMKLFSKYYPCDHCAQDFRRQLKESPPETSSGWKFSQWLCRMHNEVNRKLGKPEFNCDLVYERWRDGWEDGSCG